ncbi:MAG TPA: hypothetical protein VGB42_04845 [Candidatus Thermoplasmatota archaeon]
MSAKRAVRRYSGKARGGAKQIARSRSKIRKVERRLVEDVVSLERSAVRKAKRVEKAAVRGAKEGGRKALRGAGHLAKDTTLFCDNCGRAMRPGGHVSRMFGGHELRFCSALCSAKYRPDL